MLAVMSEPLSPNGSVCSIVSSEDSSSNMYVFANVSAIQQQSNVQTIEATTSQSCHQFVNNVVNKQIKVCRVCGDRAKSYHFGGISCDSCKAFFRRSVQNDAFLNFHCPYERHCEITINSRKSCQYCRFHKCLSIGMEKSWVMTEEERVKMLKNRVSKRKLSDTVCEIKPKDLKCENVFKYKPNINQIHSFLKEDEVKLIENIMTKIRKCSQEISFNINCETTAALNADSRVPIDILNIFFTAIQQFALFVHQFDSFASIPAQDKQILLKGGVLELCFLKGAFSYDLRGKHWRYDERSSGVIYSDNLQSLVTKDLLEKHMQFIKTIKILNLDEPTFTMLTLVILLTSDREGLTASQLVQKEQEKYLLLMKAYMNWRYGSQRSSLLFPKLLLKLTDLRELAEAHTDYQLLLGRHELQQIQHKLSTLNTAVDNNHFELTTQLTINSNDFVPEWTINQCITDPCFTIRGLYPDDELSTGSTTSEISEKFCLD
ncbi:thyroid hormone receptor beta-like [Oppia nitens]|uniref:thyroid hormone receptor beta-like n=1 Tax=Oppia nitens TaxID=1686743 RepID=UPI0023DC2915|nr:thyroid hormone receptor beta-like [Oppia nitens]